MNEGTAADGTGRGAGRPYDGSLQAIGVTRRFGGVPVLRQVSVAVPPGRIVGLVGHNGAGKSTLLRILAGQIRPDEGTVAVAGVPTGFGAPADALRAGVAAVYQELSLLSNLTVAQNVFLGREQAAGGLLRRGAMRAATVDLLAQFDLDIDPDRRLGDYPVATRQLLEIAVATHRRARFLLLDEPTTSLEGGQVERLLQRLRRLAAERDLGILLVDHKLDELYAVADHVVALVDGEVLLDAPLAQVSRREVVRAIAGDEVADTLDGPVASAVPAAAGPSAEAPAGLAVRGLQTAVLADVSLTAQQGRVLGVYGLVGSGRTELLRALVGLDRVRGGEVRLGGLRYVPRDPAAARRAGLVYLTEERKRDGLVPGMDAVSNVALPVLDRFRRLGLLDRNAMRVAGTELLDRLQVRGDRAGAVQRLSGGNQQKVLLARVLAQRPRTLLLDEPTRGVDIGVKVQIHRIIRQLAHEQGITVVLVSSEEEEILDVADDVVVFLAGRCDGISRPAGSLGAADLRRAAWPSAT